MRHAVLRAVSAAALAALGLAGVSARAQEAEAPIQYGVSTGYNLLPLSLNLIEATRSGVAFEAVSDTRFRILRHMATKFPCMFLPDTAAVVTLVAASEGAQPGDDAVCIEQQDETEVAYRITRRPAGSLDDAFAAARAAASGWLTGEIVETTSAPNLLTSPTQPTLGLNMPRQQTLLIGESARGRAMLRVAVAELPNDWYVTQSYFSPLTGEEETQGELAVLGSSLAEVAFAIQLGETFSPTPDPAGGSR